MNFSNGAGKISDIQFAASDNKIEGEGHYDPSFDVTDQDARARRSSVFNEELLDRLDNSGENVKDL